MNDVLTRYPAIGLHGVAIAELGGGEMSRMIRDTHADESPVTWIVLSLVAACNPDVLAGRVQAAIRSADLVHGSDVRPVYSTIVRELGRAFDAAGAFRARTLAQKALIAAYLCIQGADRHEYRLGRVVGGYRRWRAQLPGCEGDNGRFDPGSAVAEAFTDVVLHGNDASEQAKILHRVLIDAAPRT
ncbi:hypothetical protein ACQP1G_20225 [Nocardia sp. CA-107356]|uniref:hypothetical protein n=1 Tax=Nocardia sp. CA-107356 TaxID=3239972 RepID=UPI003D92F8DC